MRCFARFALLVSAIAFAPLLPASAEPLTVLAGPIEPWSIENGDRPGVMVEMLTEMAKRANIEVNLKFEPWSRAQSDTQAGKDLAIIALTRTPEREPKYTWIVPLLSDPLWLHATRGDLNISALDKASTLNISVLRGTPQEDTLRQAGLTKLDLTTDDDSGAKMLKAGRVDAWFTRGMSASYSYGKIGGDPKQLLRGAETATPPMYLAGSRDFSPELAAKLNKAFESMKADGSYDKIVKSYQ